MTSVNAFDLLFKLYFVLNVEYPTKLINYYEFFQCFIYNISTRKRSIGTSMHINICNSQIDM